MEGLVEGSVVHFHRARTINVETSGIISTSGMGKYSGYPQINSLVTSLSILSWSVQFFSSFPFVEIIDELE